MKSVDVYCERQQAVYHVFICTDSGTLKSWRLVWVVVTTSLAIHYHLRRTTYWSSDFLWQRAHKALFYNGLSYGK